MPSRFHADFGPIQLDLQLDERGIRFERGGRSESIPWERVTGACFIPPHGTGDLDDEATPHGRDTRLNLEGLLGQEAAEKIQEMRASVGEVIVAYRDDRNRLRKTSLPAPFGDRAILNEFQSRLGSRWLGEFPEEPAALGKLGTGPGCFTSIFILAALFFGFAVIAAVFFASALAPILNFLSIQKMLLDLQDAHYESLASRFATYVALLVLAYFIHRLIRSKLDQLKRRSAASRRLP